MVWYQCSNFNPRKHGLVAVNARNQRTNRSRHSVSQQRLSVITSVIDAPKTGFRRRFVRRPQEQRADARCCVIDGGCQFHDMVAFVCRRQTNGDRCPVVDTEITRFDALGQLQKPSSGLLIYLHRPAAAAAAAAAAAVDRQRGWAGQ